MSNIDPHNTHLQDNQTRQEKQRKIHSDLIKIVTHSDAVLTDTADLRPFETDAFIIRRELPLAVVLPTTVEEVAQVLAYCYRSQINVVARGAGTSLSGGSIPDKDGILLVMSKFSEILDIDTTNRCAVVQPGLVNQKLSEAVAGLGFFYAPDPSSQSICSLGGNVAENSGGLHCLKYGLTSHNVLGLQCVLIDGSIIRLGGRSGDTGNLDLIGIITGSEGMLAVVTEITVRLIPKPETVKAALLGFARVEDAGNCVGTIIREGMHPAGLEMMDKEIVKLAEDHVHAGYPLDVEALLIVEIDGLDKEVDEQLEVLFLIAERHDVAYTRVSSSEEERQRIWAGRKAAFPAVAAISRDYICMDGSIPRNKLAEVLDKIVSLSQKYGLRVVNVFHAGDGNLHPLILFDASMEDELQRAEDLGSDILRLCVSVGGVLSGEHGIGLEKRHLMGEQFNKAELDQQQRLKCAFDPDHLLNPGKMFPVLHRCAELGWMHVQQKGLPHSDIPRF